MTKTRNDVILALLTATPQSPKELSAKTGYTLRQTGGALHSLRTQGLSVLLPSGQWIAKPETDVFAELESLMRAATRARIEKEKVRPC